MTTKRIDPNDDPAAAGMRAAREDNRRERMTREERLSMNATQDETARRLTALDHLTQYADAFARDLHPKPADIRKAQKVVGALQKAIEKAEVR